VDVFQPADYGPVFAPLLGGRRDRALDHGAAETARRADLERATLEAAFAHATVVDRDMARCCLSGLWLVHDFLDRSHAVSQEIETPSGSFWHGVMHRREGDYSNAKYWFRRVGRHEALAPLAAHAAALGASLGEPRLAALVAPGREFDPFAMVDACERAVRAGGSAETFCRRLQQAEWESLFDHCYRGAVAA
jgi:hypothetical protein